MIHSRRARLSTGIVLGVVAAMVPLAALSGAASAAGPGPNTPTQVPSGITAATLPGTQVFGDAPSDTPEIVSFILKEQNVRSLEAQVESGIPSSQYLSVSQFAARYGQPVSSIDALTSYLAGFGITTDVYADHVDVVANGTAGEFDKALTITEKEATVPQLAGTRGFGPIPQQHVFTNTSDPLLPYHLASFVLAILGLTNYSPMVDQIAKPLTSYSLPQAGSNSTCVAEFGLPNGCHLPSDFAQMYNLDPLYAKANGSGETLGIVTLAKPDPGAPQYFWANIAHVTRTGTFTDFPVDGGAPGPSGAVGSDESDLDIEQSGALAPGANVISYEAPNTDYGFADGFFTAASQNVAGTVSTSWGESETVLEAAILAGQEASTIQAAFDEAFLEMAAQGQSLFIATGDEGAYAASRDLGTTNLSIQSPSDSPFDTAAGGTTLPWTGTFTGPDGSATFTVPAQRIWGWDYLWPVIAKITGTPEADVAESLVVGGTGGYSVLEPEPSYQTGVSGTSNFNAVEYLTPIDDETIVPGLVEPTEWSFNPNPPVTSGATFGARATPDVSTDADPETGYLVYGASAGGLNEYGGTSFVAPQLNGAASVIDSYLGHRVGLWNPVIYGIAPYGGGAFTQLNTAGTSNDNLYFTGAPGELYNAGDGLGLPNLARVATAFSVPFI
jgi:kumamolisin